MNIINRNFLISQSTYSSKIYEYTVYVFTFIVVIGSIGIECWVMDNGRNAINDEEERYPSIRDHFGL